MKREMLDDGIDRFEHADLPALDRPPRRKVVRRQGGDHRVYLVERLLQRVEELGRRRATARGELTVPVATIRRLTNTGDNPLPNIAGEMHKKIADTIRLIVGAPPECLGRKRFDSSANLGAVLGLEVVPRAGDERLREIHEKKDARRASG